MSVSELNAGSAVLAAAGLTLVTLSMPQLKAPARFLRGWFWKLVILYGESAAVPLYFLSILMGLLAGLPFFTTLILPPADGGMLHFSASQFALILLTLVFRLTLWPAISLDWATVRKWEQEVVRRPRGRFWAYLRTANHSARELLNKRATELCRQLSHIELNSSSSFHFIPVRSLGLILLYSASLGIPPALRHVQVLSHIGVGTACLWTFSDAILQSRPLARLAPKWSYLLMVSCAALFAGLWTFSEHGVVLGLSGGVVSDICRVALLTCILTCFFRDLETITELPAHSGPDEQSASVDNKYAVLRKLTYTAQVLTKPRILVSFIMQIDALLTTLRITLSW